VTDNPHGPDKPCQRSRCVAEARYAAQDAQAQDIASGTDPVDALADPLPAVGDHLGGAHLDPTDRDHYDGIGILYRASPHTVRDAVKPLIAHVDGFNPRGTHAVADTPLRAMVEVALESALREIDRLREQVAHVKVDADRKVREASRAALDCADHGQVIYDLEKQVIGIDVGRAQTENARLALLGEHQFIRDLLDAMDSGRYIPADVNALTAELRSINRRTSNAHTRAWKDRT
jgi:hypothetical protein